MARWARSQSALRHFEVESGGFLPATADSVARYLADHAESLAINTLRQRLAALAQCHTDQAFPDPTKVPIVTCGLHRRPPATGANLNHEARQRKTVSAQVLPFLQLRKNDVSRFRFP